MSRNARVITCNVAAVSLVLLAPLIAAAAPGDLLLTIYNPTPVHDDAFGATVASVGNRIVIGAPLDSTRESEDGAVYLYDSSGALLRTIFQPTLHPSIGVINGYFGTQVASFGENFFVSSLRVRTNPTTMSRGRVYLFDQQGQVVRTFANPVATGNIDNFGISISVFDRFLAVGARAAHVTQEGSGAAFLFDATTGAHLQTYLNPNPAPLFGGNSDNFGNEVDVFGDRVYVTASHFRNSQRTQGAVYVYDRDSGELLDTFRNPEGDVDGVWASTVAVLDEGRLLIGTEETFEFGRGGIAQIIDAHDGSLITSLRQPPPSHDYARFGGASTRLGSGFVVGSPGTIVDGEQAGAAFIYDRTGQLQLTIENPTPLYLEVFSNSLSTMGNNLIVGSPNAVVGIAEVGAVYVFSGVVPEPATYLTTLIGVLSIVVLQRYFRTRPVNRRKAAPSQ